MRTDRLKVQNSIIVALKDARCGNHQLFFYAHQPRDAENPQLCSIEMYGLAVEYIYLSIHHHHHDHHARLKAAQCKAWKLHIDVMQHQLLQRIRHVFTELMAEI
jgi:hypothetical protein